MSQHLSNSVARAGEIMNAAIARASSGSSASVPPVQGGSQASAGHPGGPQTTTGGGGSGNAPINGGSGGPGGGTGGTGISGWWKRQDFWTKSILLVVSGFVFSFLFNSWTMMWNEKISTQERTIALQSAENKVQLAELAARESSVSVVRTPQIENSLPVVVATTFDCSTPEKMERNFNTTGAIDVPAGIQVLLKNGCAWLQFNHNITTLQGSEYVISFDPVSDPGAQYCGQSARRGRNDSPATCLSSINNNIGRKFRVEIGDNSSNFFKIGGPK